jgi:epoxyqueuosine reductase QueG
VSTNATPVREACTACADACPTEDTVEQLKLCIRFNLDFADVCTANSVLASRRTQSNEQMLLHMLQICEATAM